MKIVWRNPNRVAPNRVSIVKTGESDTADQVQLFYRSSSGAGILGTEFELRVSRGKPVHAA